MPEPLPEVALRRCGWALSRVGARSLAASAGLALLASSAPLRGEPGLSTRASAEVSAYSDTDHTAVLTPAVVAAVESPAGGFGLSASFLVDVVSSASVDIVATASPRWTEVRYAPALEGHKKLGDADVSLRGNLSHEPDYLSLGVGAGISVDLRDQTVTPSLGYGFSRDTIGRAGTPFDVFSRTLDAHAIDLGLGLVVGKATLLLLSATEIVEVGDSSKPYRTVPMFDAASALRVSAGASRATVDALRTVDRPLEQLPDERQRHALEAELAHRFSKGTLRVSERLYADSWGLLATTTDARYAADVGKLVRAGPHVRLHAQDGVDFWRLAYLASSTPGGTLLPALRTGDRELGPLAALTTGLGVRVAFGESPFAAAATAEATFTWFLDHLYISRRTGVLATTAVEAVFP